jgi:hypothetical protein
MAKTLELTWIAKLRQWRKRRFVKGKRKDFYLGTGTSKDDRRSYQLALAKWKIKEAELGAAKAEDESQQPAMDVNVILSSLWACWPPAVFRCSRIIWAKSGGRS